MSPDAHWKFFLAALRRGDEHRMDYAMQRMARYAREGA